MRWNTRWVNRSADTVHTKSQFRANTGEVIRTKLGLTGVTGNYQGKELRHMQFGDLIDRVYTFAQGRQSDLLQSCSVYSRLHFAQVQGKPGLVPLEVSRVSPTRCLLQRPARSLQLKRAVKTELEKTHGWAFLSTSPPIVRAVEPCSTSIFPLSGCWRSLTALHTLHQW